MAPETLQESIKKQIKPAIIIFIILTVITGILYPLVVTGLSQVLFPVQANGNFFEHNGSVAGSSLIGQPFSSPAYFWGRLSATSPSPYNATPSAASNYGPSNPALASEVQARLNALHAADPGNTGPVPVDLVTSSGSGLDPDISPAAAYYQAPRVAQERNLSEADVKALVAGQTETPLLGIFGENRVNVLKLNLALDDLSNHRITVPSTVIPGNQPATTVFGIKINDWILLILFGILLAFLIVPVGTFMARIYSGSPTFLSPVVMPLERWILKISGVGIDDEMDWKAFATAMIIFNTIGIIAVFLLENVQQLLPLNPGRFGPVPWDLALNTAVSFATNTNWQAYAGETTMSYLTQMTGLAVQNFLSASTGMAVLIALVYAFSRKSTDKIGNFWVLLVRSVMILLPIAFIIALVLVSQGSPQTFNGPVTIPLLDPVRDANGIIITAFNRSPSARWHRRSP